MMNKYIKMTLLFVPLMGLAVFGFNNCARYNQLNDSASTDSASLGNTDSGSLSSQKLGLPYALLSAEQTLTSMMKVTNVTTISNTLLSEYNVRYGSLAAGNDLSMANGPLFLGTTSLAGEVCNNLLTQEKGVMDPAARNFFGSINFASGATSVTDTSFNTSVRGMARSFWGRNETTEELALIQQYKTDFISALDETTRTQAASTSNLMLASCAAILSSVDAISY